MFIMPDRKKFNAKNADGFVHSIFEFTVGYLGEQLDVANKMGFLDALIWTNIAPSRDKRHWLFSFADEPFNFLIRFYNGRRAVGG
jgi:hypothetical protein